MEELCTYDDWWWWQFTWKPPEMHLMTFKGYPKYGLQYIDMIGGYMSKKPGTLSLDRIYNN